MIDDKEVLTSEREREICQCKRKKYQRGRESERERCDMIDDKEVLTSERERDTSV